MSTIVNCSFAYFFQYELLKVPYPKDTESAKIEAHRVEVVVIPWFIFELIDVSLSAVSIQHISIFMYISHRGCCLLHIVLYVQSTEC